MRARIAVVAWGSILVGLTSLAGAAGFRVSEQGAKATAMANAFAAQADDPSALAYNPAGIAFLKGYQVMLGATAILVPQTQFTGVTRLSGGQTVSERANRDMFFPPNFYATASLGNSPVSVGLGINSFFPLAKRWDGGGAFRDIVQEISIKPVNFQPTVACRFDDLKLAAAAGLDVTYAQVSLQKLAYSPLPSPPFPSSIAGPYQELGPLGVDGTAVGMGYNFGIQWKPLKKLSFGVAYRSQVHLDVDGDANFTPTAAGAAVVGTSGVVRSSAATSITLPDILTVGVAYLPTERWTVEFDAERTGWSSYDQLNIVFGPQLSRFNNTASNPAPKRWEDVWAYRLGTQYAITGNLDLRMGYAYDTSPQPNDTTGPELPDGNRHNLSFGFGLHNDYNTFDAGFMWVHFQDRTVTSPPNTNGITGTFASDAYLFGANLTMKF